MFGVDTRGEQRRLLGMGDDGIYADAWGRQKVITDYSIFTATFSSSASLSKWIEYNDGVEQYVKNNASIVNGEGVVTSNGGSTFLMSARNPKYQGNRGHLYSSSAIVDNASRANGTLYAVVRTYRDSTVIEDRQEIDISTAEFNNFDPSKGNTYDIQAQLRDVGNIKLFINQKEVYFFGYAGKQSNLILSNMNTPLSFECTNTGIVRWGMFTPQCGIFFEWEFDTPQETTIRSGCVDLTSEGGADQRQTFVSAVGNKINGATDEVVLAVRVPETLDGQINTIDAELARLKADVSKKSDIEVWATRNPTALTITTGTWEALNGGNLEKFAPAASGASTFDTAKARLVDVIPVEANTNNRQENPNPAKIQFFLVHGDILIMKLLGTTVDTRVIVQLGDEI